MPYQEASIITCDVAGCGHQTTIVGTKTASEDYKLLEAQGWKHIEGHGVLCPECAYQHEARAAQLEGER